MEGSESGLSTMDMDGSILDGSAEEVVGSSSRIIRVFLSSTFSDMSEERNLLLKEVYPRIQEYTKKKYGVNFQMVDMRWGVTSEAQNDHLTSMCCLKEIRNCQKVSIGPNFVALIGQKYGYRPIPATIDAEEFETLHKLLDDTEEDLSVLDVWYLKDENSVPAQYVLQPINSILKNYDSSDDDLKKASRDEWQDTFEELRSLLMKASQRAFDEGLIGGQTKEKYFNSVTQEEVEVGLLENPGDANKSCLCFVREITDLYENTHHHRALKFVDLRAPTGNGDPVVDTEAQDMLKILRDSTIPNRLNKANIVRLSTQWSDKGGINPDDNTDYLEDLATAFHDKMIWLIDENLQDMEVRNGEHMQEVRQSLQIRDEWSRTFFGRQDTLRLVERYLKDGASRAPYVLYGASGCGKTALIAKCAKETRKWCKETDPVIIMRFMGTSPQTSHILLMLTSLCTQICDVYNFDKKGMPSEYKEVIEFFNGLLTKVSLAKRPLSIYLDSIDQLSASCEPYTFNWLPRLLPPNVKVVMSLIPSVNNLLNRFQAHYPGHTTTMEPIPILGDNLSMEIVTSRLRDADRTITSQQSVIITNLLAQCSLPLFSRIMYEEIVLWRSYTTITHNMVSSSMKEALNNFFRRLESNHGRMLVHHALGYISAAKDGLSELELLDLLSLDDDVLNSVFLFWLPPIRRLPPFLWTRLRLDLDVFLVTRNAGDVEVLAWYHRLFKEAAVERYLMDPEAANKIHASLSDYFLGKWSAARKPFRYSKFLTNRLALSTSDGAETRHVQDQPIVYAYSRKGTVFNKRKLEELPYHLIKSGQFDILCDTCIFNYRWLWTKISVFGLPLLLEDFELVQTTIDNPEIQALADALRIAGSGLNEYPNLLGLEITGRLLDLFDSMPKIRHLVQQCDIQGKRHSAIVSPIQLYEVPISALTKSLDASTSDVGDAEFLKNDTELVTISVDGKVTKWDVTKGTVINEVHLPKLASLSYREMGITKTKDEQYLICEGQPSNMEVMILNAETLQLVKRHKSTSQHLQHNIAAGRTFVCMDNGVYEANTGKKVHDFKKYKKIDSFVKIAFSVCDQYIFIGGNKYLDMFSVEKAKLVKHIALPQCVSELTMTSDGRLAIVGLTIDCKIKIFDINVKSQTFGQEVVTYDPNKAFPNENLSSDDYATTEVSEISISNKGGAFVSLVKRKYPIVWSLKNISTKPRLLKLSSATDDLRYLYDVQFSNDDRYILAAELSPIVMMWDAVTGEILSVFKAQQNDVHLLLASTKLSMVLSLQQNGTVINLWDLQKVLKMEEVSTKRETSELAVRNMVFSNSKNLVFLSQVHPPKSSKVYHYIDFFGIDVVDLATGKQSPILPFDKYGVLQSITVSKDASVFVIVTGTSIMSVFDTTNAELLSSRNIPRFKGVKISAEGKYLCVFTSDEAESQATLYATKTMQEIGVLEDCHSGLFTKQNAFVGVTDNEMLVRESVEDEELLKIDLQGDVMAIHYSDTAELLLVTLEDGMQLHVKVFKTEGFGIIGTINEVSKQGISDISSDGQVCIDSELQVFELERCKRVKQLLPHAVKKDVTSVRLSANGEHAVFIDSIPTNCIKVCRIEDSQIVAMCNLHCIPERLEIVTTLNLIVVLGKDKSVYYLSLKDGDRDFTYASTSDRMASIIGTTSHTDVSKFRVSRKCREVVKEQAKAEQVKRFNMTLERIASMTESERKVASSSSVKSKGSMSCVIV